MEYDEASTRGFLQANLWLCMEILGMFEKNPQVDVIIFAFSPSFR